jgi:hypothetical protein
MARSNDEMENKFQFEKLLSKSSSFIPFSIHFNFQVIILCVACHKLL